MNRTRKYLALLLAALCLNGCAAKTVQKEQNVEELHAAATFYPIYALTSLIADEIPDLHLSCLVQPQDGCLRTYTLSDWDLSLISGSDAVICGGNGLESFETVLTSLGEDGPVVAEVMTGCTFETVEYVNLVEDEDSHFAGENPFVYMSTDGAIELTGHIEACLAALDPKYEDLYAENLKAAQKKLEALKTELHAVSGDLAGKKVAVLNEAFLYTTKEFSLEPAVCWARESGEEMSDEEFERCVQALNDAVVQVVLLEKQAPQRLVKALTDAGFIVAKLDTLSTGRAQTGAEDYFEALRENAQALRDAFTEVSE